MAKADGQEERSKAVEVKAPPTMRSLIITWDTLDKENRVNVTGSIADIGQCYRALEIAKDILRKWNELNNHYLEFNATPLPAEKLN